MHPRTLKANTMRFDTQIAHWMFIRVQRENLVSSESANIYLINLGEHTLGLTICYPSEETLSWSFE